MFIAPAPIKTANVSGQFYEADPEALALKIDSYLASAPTPHTTDRIPIIFVPHAGHQYSGAIAAHAFKAISLQRYRTVVMLAPSHYMGFDGVAIWNTGAFETPLGIVPVDHLFATQLIDPEEGWNFDAVPFLREHALEVELPFMQRIFPQDTYRIVPIIFGELSEQEIQRFTERLDQIIGDRTDVLLVVSTDLSHYHDDAIAQRMDAHTMQLLHAGDPHALWAAHQDQSAELCGYAPAMIALQYAQRHQWRGMEVLRYTHSGDMGGDNVRVVGYMAGMITAPRPPVLPLTTQQQLTLLEFAYQAIHQYLLDHTKISTEGLDPRFDIMEGAFVTIYYGQQLRGCIGQALSKTPLCDTIRDMAIAAATQDTRFKPITADLLADLEIEISVLSVPQPITDIAEITLGTHGIVISKGDKQGCFLPQVGRTTGWSKEELLSKLCMQKAGLPASTWKEPGIDLQIFTSTVFSKKTIAGA